MSVKSRSSSCSVRFHWIPILVVAIIFLLQVVASKITVIKVAKDIPAKLLQIFLIWKISISFPSWIIPHFISLYAAFIKFIIFCGIPLCLISFQRYEVADSFILLCLVIMYNNNLNSPCGGHSLDYSSRERTAPMIVHVHRWLYNRKVGGISEKVSTNTVY